ncbi:MAG: tetratricopeptide repeat protein [Minicystis sp.]
MSKRLAYLEKITTEGSKDPFAWYGLAMEYGNLGRTDESLQTFNKLREIDEAYVAMYLMCGNFLLKASRTAEGRAWLEDGIAMAKKTGNSHALSELQDALAALGTP